MFMSGYISATLTGIQINQTRYAVLFQKTVMNEYGATNPAEFFAVATECFFEKPGQLKAKHPDLYDELRRFYQQDPSQRNEQPPSPKQRAPSR
jgi:Mlc titration factor MtfA (ptsG expression regulator)